MGAGGDYSHREPAADARLAAIGSGHPEISWSIVLDARLTAPPDPSEVRSRLAACWPADERLGPLPDVRVATGTSTETRALVEDLANRPYVAGRPLARVAVVGGPEPRLVVAAHHGALDGLGLVALLGHLVGTPLRSSARGIDPARLPPPDGIARTVRRAAEALASPPLRIAPTRRDGGPGDLLSRLEVDGEAVHTADLLVAAARAVRWWNRAAGARTEPVVVAVGASARPGAEADLAERSAWFRLRLPPDATPDGVRRLLAERRPEPPTGLPSLPGPLRAGAARTARLLARRTGSTLLVSNLGTVTPAPPESPISSLAFHPAAHGRSGVSVGAVRVGETTVLTLRARRRDFSRTAADRLLARVEGELRALGRR